ncbi:MAG: hypothetical protein ACR2MT_11040 [Aurantibacter sp.]
MFAKNNLVATVVAAIWSFGGGFLLWGVLAAEFLGNHLGSATGLMKDPPEFALLAVGCIIQALVFCTIFGKWGVSNYTAMEGMRFGVLMGLLVGFGDGLINYATSNMLDMTGAIVNGLLYVFLYAVMGLLVGLIYNKVK